MKPQMLIEGQPVPTGGLKASLELRSEKGGEDFALLHIATPSGDERNDRSGGVALNCLYAGPVTSLEALFNKPLMFDRQDGRSSELAESVFWRPGPEDMEIRSVRVLIEPGKSGTVLLTIHGCCYDGNHRYTGIEVEIRGEAQAEVYPSRRYPLKSYSAT
jgi:hypothetical protein